MNRRAVLGSGFGLFLTRLLPWKRESVEIVTDPDRADLIERRVVKGAVQIFDEDGNCIMIVRPLWK